MDQEIRQLEQQLKLNPNDQETLMLLVNAKERIGCCQVRTYFRIQRNDGRWLARRLGSVFLKEFEDHGEVDFVTKEDAMNRLLLASKSKTENHTFTLISFVERTTQVESSSINLQEAKTYQELEKLRRAKEEYLKKLETLEKYEKQLTKEIPVKEQQTDFNRGLL